MSHKHNCPLCAQNTGAVPTNGGIIFQDTTWLLRHFTQGRGVSGWLVLQTMRHVSGVQDFDDNEADTLGPMIRRTQRALLRITGAERIYIASMNESSPHFHCHLVPRYATMPLDAVGWSLFDLPRASEAGEYAVDDARSLAICDELRQQFAAGIDR